MADAGGGEEHATSAPVVTRDAFISYASQDAAIANALCNALEQAGVACWLAPRDVRPGDFYADAIVQAITQCRVLILVLSQAAIDSPHVLREVERASSKKRAIISFRTDTAPLPPGLEYFLSASQWLDASGGSPASQFSKLVDAVRSRETSAVTIEPIPSKIAGIRPGRNRTAALMVAMILGAVALVYFVADKHWFSNRVAVDNPTPAAVNLAAPIPNPASVAPAFAPPPHSIAVLPFVNMSGDATQEYFSDGVTEELLDSLSHLSELQVMARTSSFSFKGQNVDILTIAHKLNVGTILEGSVRRAGNTVRITVQLINAVNGFQLWSQTYDRQLSDILKVQRDVATSVAQQLKVQLAGDETAKIELGGTKIPEAYDAYLRGLHLLLRGDTDEAGDKATIVAFDHAIALDPGYALAFSGRAAAVANFAAFNAKPGERARLREQARAAAERGVALAPELGRPHLVLAQVRAFLFADYAGAASELDRAKALEPGSASVQSAFASVYSLLGESEFALKAARRAVLLDPQDIGTHILLGQCSLEAHHYSEALAALQDAKALNPDSHLVQQLITEALLASGQTQQAREDCESPSKLLDEDFRHHCLALVYHALGRQTDADRELEQLKALNGDGSAYGYAQIYAQWDDKPRALQWLSTAERLHAPALALLRVDWQLDPIRAEPQFKVIEARTIVPP